MKEKRQELTDDEKLHKQALNVILDDRKQLLKNVFNFTNRGSYTPQSYIDAFNLFVEWANKCLDCYRVELFQKDRSFCLSLHKKKRKRKKTKNKKRNSTKQTK